MQIGPSSLSQRQKKNCEKKKKPTLSAKKPTEKVQAKMAINVSTGSLGLDQLPGLAWPIFPCHLPPDPLWKQTQTNKPAFKIM